MLLRDFSAHKDAHSKQHKYTILVNTYIGGEDVKRRMLANIHIYTRRDKVKMKKATRRRTKKKVISYTHHIMNHGLDN